MDDLQYRELAAQIDELIARMEALPDSTAKAEMFELLKMFDQLHRQALLRLVKLIRERSSAVNSAMKRDFVIQTLLMLYDIVGPEDIPEPSVIEGSFIPVDQIQYGNPRKPKQPIWLPLGDINKMQPGAIAVRKTEDAELLLCRVENEVYAVQNGCLDSVLPLAMGRMEDHILICPWHGCRYDLRSGEIQNDSGLKLETFPVEIDAKGRIMVGFNINNS